MKPSFIPLYDMLGQLIERDKIYLITTFYDGTYGCYDVTIGVASILGELHPKRREQYKRTVILKRVMRL